MTLIAFLLFLNPIFASGISFTPEQCKRFKVEGITGGDYYINEALARDCKIQVPDGGGYFPPMVLNPTETHKKDCGMKNLALDGNNSGYLQDVVTFNDMHPDYFYPDRGDEFPFVFAIQVPGMNGEANVGNAVGVDVDSVPGCRKKIEELLGEPLKDNKIIMTAGHLFVNEKNGLCTIANQSNINNTYLASGKDVSNYNFLTKAKKVVCAASGCRNLDRDIYNDFCVVIPEKKISSGAKYRTPKNAKKEQKMSKLVAYQSDLVSYSRRKDIKSTERMISISKDRPKLTTNNEVSKSNDIIYHFADAAEGASGGALLNSENNILGLHVGELMVDNDQKIQKGIRGTWMSNHAIDIQKACQRLSTVLN